MEAAPALDAPAEGALPETATTAAAKRQRVPCRSKRLANTTAYPNRVHGRLFGTFEGLGDYSCSATVVSSRTGKLITTAGHCVFDAGGTNKFASALSFVPGYRNGNAPFGQWDATNAVTTRAWAQSGNLDYDTGFVQLGKRNGKSVQSVVGSRGIGFGQPRNQKYLAFGYPAAPAPYDGEELVRCRSRYTPDPAKHSPNRSLGMGCDMQQGSSGGGWVAQDSFVVSNVSHGHPGYDTETFFGPHYAGATSKLYRFGANAYPSIGPVGCDGHKATIVGTDRSESIHGSGKDDVIATLDGDDRVRTGGGKDVVCGGGGDDTIGTGGGRDRIDGGSGEDVCDGGASRDRAKACEQTPKVP
jgi:V8-like Glu-specific endopeptidase